jgi:hypothetical protein
MKITLVKASVCIFLHCHKFKTSVPDVIIYNTGAKDLQTHLDTVQFFRDYTYVSSEYTSY